MSGSRGLEIRSRRDYPPRERGVRRIRIRGGVALVGAVVVFGGGVGASASTPRLGHGTVVEVAGHAISKKTFDHWIRVAAMSESAQTPGSPVIVPTDPPRFARCIKALRAKIHSLAHKRARTLRLDCRQLFATLSNQVLDYLIKAHWYDDLAAADHVRITHQRVLRAFRRARRQQFGTRGAFKRFLRETGQTVDDILFRFRVNIAYTALLKRAHDGSSLKAQEIVNAEAKRRFRLATTCARYYVMVDCANFRPHHSSR